MRPLLQICVILFSIMSKSTILFTWTISIITIYMQNSVNRTNLYDSDDTRF